MREQLFTSCMMSNPVMRWYSSKRTAYLWPLSIVPPYHHPQHSHYVKCISIDLIDRFPYDIQHPSSSAGAFAASAACRWASV